MSDKLINAINWTDDGLVAAIAQDADTGENLMLAWMNAESLTLAMKEQRAIYYSRSRQALWRKGESSGHVQELKSIFLDCDADVILLKVKQIGDIACHTGRRSCFYREFKDGDWQTVTNVLKDPKEIYS